MLVCCIARVWRTAPTQAGRSGRMSAPGGALLEGGDAVLVSVRAKAGRIVGRGVKRRAFAIRRDLADRGRLGGVESDGVVPIDVELVVVRRAHRVEALPQGVEAAGDLGADRLVGEDRRG